jgi:hypothetical protein
VGVGMASASTFDKLYEFFYKYKVNQIAELNTEVVGFKTRAEYLTEEMKAYADSFFDATNRLLRDVHFYSQNTGPVVLEWLDLIDQLLSATEGIIKIGLENLVEEDETRARALKFSVYSLQSLIQFARKEIRKKRGDLRKRYSLAMDVRESTLVLLTNVFYYFIKILIASIKVANREEEPEQILSVSADAFYKLRQL